MAIREVVDEGAWAQWGREALEALEQATAAGWYPARRRFLSRLAELQGPDPTAWVPEADLVEGPRELVLSVALPGVEKADIRVQVAEDEVVVSGTRRGEGEGVIEQPRGPFRRRVRLPASVKPAAARASYRNGVLRLELPRAKAAFGRHVKVE